MQKGRLGTALEALEVLFFRFYSLSFYSFACFTLSLKFFDHVTSDSFHFIFPIVPLNHFASSVDLIR